jgi:hypothetical protein
VEATDRLGGVSLADYEMEVSAPGFVADIADAGTFDFLIVIGQE